jgi:hypothetical protein
VVRQVVVARAQRRVCGGAHGTAAAQLLQRRPQRREARQRRGPRRALPSLRSRGTPPIASPGARASYDGELLALASVLLQRRDAAGVWGGLAVHCAATPHPHCDGGPRYTLHRLTWSRTRSNSTATVSCSRSLHCCPGPIASIASIAASAVSTCEQRRRASSTVNTAAAGVEASSAPAC